ncbi:MAG: hypothetical protein KIT72_00395 [Polyangiaceae bacterium]|nr:hypothetical protein [Polyangiaceae bacterium]MCW5788855.1 hypothetical protein [Polyangiaceae bacterium]
MTWSLFRWTWQLEGPLHVGMPPAGSLNRTRLYVPARALWGALTAELARREAQAGNAPQYPTVGEHLQKDYRFTYLYPAEKVGDTWRAWLPSYRDTLGLGWSREDQTEAVVSDRQLRRRLLSTRPGTSIDASTDAADDGSLRETEVLEAHWRDAHGGDGGLVALVGYVFIRTAKAKDKFPVERRRLDAIKDLFIGGDTRYGLGHVRRIAFDIVKRAEAFGGVATLNEDSPQIEASTVHAHARGGAFLKGALELLGGWDRGAIRDLDQSAPLWQPGSYAALIQWSIEADGSWKAVR